jgi:hypothetical protein
VVLVNNRHRYIGRSIPSQKPSPVRVAWIPVPVVNGWSRISWETESFGRGGMSLRNEPRSDLSHPVPAER